MCLTNVSIEAQLFLRKFVVRQGERETDRQTDRERWGALGARAEAYIMALPRRQKIIDGRTAGHYRLQDGIDVTPSCIDRIYGRRAASNN
jgi:hypothetical protein